MSIQTDNHKRAGLERELDRPDHHNSDEGRHPSSGAFGRHFTAAELGEIWKLDESTIRRIFQDEPGVLKIGNAAAATASAITSLYAYPESVALRVYQERSR